MSAELWPLVDLVTPMALRVAATLRIADHITHGLRTASELVEVEHVDPDALDRLLRHLAAVDVLSRDEPGRYSLTPRVRVTARRPPVGPTRRARHRERARTS